MGKSEKFDSAVRYASFFGMTETSFDPVLMFNIMIAGAVLALGRGN